MKPFETFKSKLKIAEIVMFACFILGGFSIIFSIYIHYFIEGFLSDYGRTIINNNSDNLTFDNRYFNNFNESTPNYFNSSNPEPRIPQRMELISFARFFTLPNNPIMLISGIVLIIAGLTINSLTTQKRTQLTIKKTTEALLTPDEKLILDIILKHNGEVTQKELTLDSGLSKVKIFRVTERLLNKGIIDKKDYGQTRKILLKSE